MDFREIPGTDRDSELDIGIYQPVDPVLFCNSRRFETGGRPEGRIRYSGQEKLFITW